MQPNNKFDQPLRRRFSVINTRCMQDIKVHGDILPSLVLDAANGPGDMGSVVSRLLYRSCEGDFVDFRWSTLAGLGSDIKNRYVPR